MVIRPLCALAAALLVLPPQKAAAQDPVTKPTRAPSATRLPGPRSVAARQLEDGRIEVRWTRIPGAVRYDILRSSPSFGNTAIKPGPTDTLYIDTDVKAGNYYYYVVNAVDSAGNAGLKASGSVQAKISATTSEQALRPTTTGDESTSAGGAPGEAWSVIKNVALAPAGWDDPDEARVAAWWDYTQGGVYFVIERAVSYPQKGAWQTYYTTRTLPCCQSNTTIYLRGYTEGTRIAVRVTAVDSANPGRKSVPVVSNEFTVSFKRLPPPAKFTAVQQADGTVRLSWAPVAGAKFYKLQAHTHSNTRYATLAATDTAFIDRDIVADARFTYILWAVAHSWVEGLRDTITVQTRQPAPTPLIVDTYASTAVDLAVNASFPLTHRLPTGITALRWTALDETLATVDGSGTVTGRSPGSARVLATAVYSNGMLVIVPFRVNVTAPVAPASPPE